MKLTIEIEAKTEAQIKKGVFFVISHLSKKGRGKDVTLYQNRPDFIAKIKVSE